jgi:hypothetical protein
LGNLSLAIKQEDGNYLPALSRFTQANITTAKKTMTNKQVSEYSGI